MSQQEYYSIGLDYGTNSVRALIVNTANGNEVGTGVWNYEHGTNGVILSNDPNFARQHPADYIRGAEETIRIAITDARKNDAHFSPANVIGIGVDTTGSTPLPVDENGIPLAFDARFAGNPAALAWLWKDHTSVAEAEEITALAAKLRPQFLTKCGGIYSSEWYFSKILRCLRESPGVFDAAYSWVEIADWIPAILSGTENPKSLTIGICGAGHKAMYALDWGGFPDVQFLSELDPSLAEKSQNLCKNVRGVDSRVGGLTADWADRTGLPEGIPIAVGAFDAHLGAIGAGIKEGSLVKIIGTSTCDIAISSNQRKLPDIPGLCGIVDGSVLSSFYGLEAGQSAVGDIFNWFVSYIKPDGETHESLTEQATKLKAGESGLLALDWNNGNRTVLVDQRLTGLLLGQTLYTTAAEIYRALVEATAFGALTIIRRFEEYGVRIDEVINCGGIAEKNDFVMQVYSDIIGKPMKISRSAQTCALGSAIAGAVVAGSQNGGYDSISDAQAKMTGLKERIFIPQNHEHETYQKLYEQYLILHDTFGGQNKTGDLSDVMKRLIEIRSLARQRC